MIHGTVNTIFNASSYWQSFFVADRINQEIWTKCLHPTEWSSSIVNETLDEIIRQQRITHDQRTAHLKEIGSWKKDLMEKLKTEQRHEGEMAS